MLSVGLLHSVLHTLLLALSASGRSVNGLELSEKFTNNEFHVAISVPDIWVLHTPPTLYPASRMEAMPKVYPNSPSLASIKITTRVLRQNSLEEYYRASTQADKSVWQIESVRAFDFLGAPAKNVLLRQKLGTSLTKIRKIFTVRKSNDATHVFALSFSSSSAAPPNNYQRYNPSFDEALASFFFL